MNFNHNKSKINPHADNLINVQNDKMNKNSPTIFNYGSNLNCARRITIHYKTEHRSTVSLLKSRKKFNSTSKHHTQLNSSSSKKTERLEDEHNFQLLTTFHKD